MRVAFFGSQEIGARCLEVILEGGHEVVAVATFDAEAHEHWSDDVARIVEEKCLPRIRGRRFRTKKALDALRSAAPDILFAIGWRWIVPPAVLAIPPRGCLGIHGSLLPRGRGFAPVNWALIRGEPRTGPTLFYFDAGVDTGDIVGQRAFEISDEDDAASVRARLVESSVALLREHLPPLAEGTAPRIAQNEAGATYGPRRRPQDGAIDWRQEPRTLFNWVRGLTRPYPGAFAELSGRRVSIWKVRPIEGKGPGEGILSQTHEGRLVVGAGAGAVEVLDASYEGDSSPGALERVTHDLRIAGRFTLTEMNHPQSAD